MIHEQEITGCRRRLSSKLNDIIYFGHIGGCCFTPETLKNIKSGELKMLAEQKIEMYDGDNDIFVHKPIGLWGEDSNLIGNDIGISCIFFNEEHFPLKKHFMTEIELSEFIMDIATELYPEILI